MRKVLLLGTVLFLGLLVFLPALGTAAQADLVATTGIPTQLYGSVDATARNAILSLGGAASGIAYSSRGATVDTIRVVSAYTLLAQADAVGEYRTETQTRSIAAGTVTIQPTSRDLLVAAEGTQARLVSSATLSSTPTKDVWTRSNARMSALLLDESLGAPMPSAKPAQITLGQAPTVDVDAGTYSLTANGKATMASASTVLVYGARLIAADNTVLGEGRRTMSEQPGSVYVPGTTGGTWVGPGTHAEEVVEYVVLRSATGSLTVDGPTTLYSSALKIHHVGYIGFPWAEGTLQTPNETVALSGDQVILGGDLRLHPIGFSAIEAPELTLLGNGVVDYVQIGLTGQTIANAEAAAVAGGAAAGLGTLALLVYFWPNVKWASSLLLFPLYARVPKENTLDHKGRELLYDLIKGEPGVSTNKLAKEVPFGWSTLTYHLRVLERNEAIVSVRDGRYKRFFDRQSGRFANGRKYILATLKNDATFDIARFIRQKPGSSQKEVATHFQLSPSSVHWHVERLTEVGLVQKSREAHNVKYNPGEAWDHVTIEDLKALEDAGPEPAENVPAMATPSEPAAQAPTGPASS